MSVAAPQRFAISTKPSLFPRAIPNPPTDNDVRTRKSPAGLDAYPRRAWRTHWRKPEEMPPRAQPAAPSEKATPSRMLSPARSQRLLRPTAAVRRQYPTAREKQLRQQAAAASRYRRAAAACTATAVGTTGGGATATCAFDHSVANSNASKGGIAGVRHSNCTATVKAVDLNSQANSICRNPGSKVSTTATKGGVAIGNDQRPPVHSRFRMAKVRSPAGNCG